MRVDPATPLGYVLRNHLGLTATRIGCALEQCGACAVLVDGAATLSCAAPAGQLEGRCIVTAEGLGEAARPGEVQRAFIEARAAQCGYCTPGLVVAVTALLAAKAHPSEEEIRPALRGHLCRCGAQPRVLRALRRLAANAGRES